MGKLFCADLDKSRSHLRCNSKQTVDGKVQGFEEITFASKIQGVMRGRTSPAGTAIWESQVNFGDAGARLEEEDEVGIGDCGSRRKGKGFRRVSPRLRSSPRRRRAPSAPTSASPGPGSGSRRSPSPWTRPSSTRLTSRPSCSPARTPAPSASPRRTPPRGRSPSTSASSAPPWRTASWSCPSSAGPGSWRTTTEWTTGASWAWSWTSGSGGGGAAARRVRTGRLRRGLTASVHDVVVHPSVQRRGIGRKILEKITRVLHSRGIYDISALCTGKERPFFEACGFGDDAMGATTMIYTRNLYK